MLDAPGRPARILLLGGTSEIGIAILAALRAPRETEVLLAGRDEEVLAVTGKALPYQIRTLAFDATDISSHAALIDSAFAAGAVDVVISAAGVLIPQPTLDRDPLEAGRMVETNFTGHVTTLLAAAGHLRGQGHGTIVILSSAAAVRARKASFVYGAAKAGLDAFGQGLSDAMHGTGVRVLLVRPGFVKGRMTAGMPAVPLATTPAAVGAAVAAALARKEQTAVWVPGSLRVLAPALRLVPRPVWRRIRR